MIQKIIHLIKSILNRNVVIDYKMLGMKRKNYIKIPRITNYIRIAALELAAYEINQKKLSGSVAEVGVFKGEFAKYINQLFPNKKLFLFDTFSGFDNKDIVVEKQNNFSDGNQDFSDTSANLVLQKMKFRQNCIIKKGYFPETAVDVDEEFCFVSLDPDLYKPIIDGLDYFYPRLVKGGYIFIHDFNNDMYSGAKRAVLEFCSKYDIPYVPLPDTWGTVVISK